MGLPQLVGRTCVRCRCKISSIAEGEYCSACANPVHFSCLDKSDEPIELGHCQRCGGDPRSVIADKVLDARKLEAGTPALLLCPNCGSTRGFGPYDSKGNRYPLGIRGTGLQGIAHLLWTHLARQSEVQCFKCLYVFRPRSKVREIGCVVLAVGGLLTFVAIVAWRVLQRE